MLTTAHQAAARQLSQARRALAKCRSKAQRQRSALQARGERRIRRAAAQGHRSVRSQEAKRALERRDVLRRSLAHLSFLLDNYELENRVARATQLIPAEQQSEALQSAGGFATMFLTTSLWHTNYFRGCVRHCSIFDA